jgi:tetratricopeptide (TPR) repeat protein
MRCQLLASVALVFIAAISVRGQNDALKAFDQAVMLTRQGKFQEAIPYYDKAIQMNPKLADAWQSRGYAYARLGKYNEAHRDADEALKINPKFGIAYKLKGFTNGLQRKWDEAIPFYTKAIETKAFVRALTNRGVCYYEKRDFDKAIQDLNDAVKYNARDGQAFFYLGNCFALGKNDLPKAVEYYSKAIDVQPTMPEAWGERGLCLVRIGKVEEGKKDVDKAGQLNPGLKGPYDARLQPLLPKK